MQGVNNTATEHILKSKDVGKDDSSYDSSNYQVG